MTILIILRMNFEIINLKNRKFNSVLNFIQFHYCLIIHQKLLNYNKCKLYKIVMVVDRLSNDNEII
jgi:ABC-type amino acid transport system permease subunit